MLGRIYKVTYNGTLTNAGGNSDLLSIQPADDKPCEIVGWEISQSSELGDAAEESIRITGLHMTATFTVGSGGSSVTPVANDPAIDAAAGFTARCNDTTVATTSGTSRTFLDTNWNIRSTPWEKWIPDELRQKARQTEALVIRCESTVADDITVSLTFYVQEC